MSEAGIFYTHSRTDRGIQVSTYGVVAKGEENALLAFEQLLAEVAEIPLEEGEEQSREFRAEVTLRTYPIEYDSLPDMDIPPVAPKKRISWWRKLFGGYDDNLRTM